MQKINSISKKKYEVFWTTPYGTEYRLVKLLAAKERGETLEGETAIALVENSGPSGALALAPGGISMDEDDTSRDANSGPGANLGSGGSVKNSGSHHLNDESNHSWLRDQQQEFMDIEGECKST